MDSTANITIPVETKGRKPSSAFWQQKYKTWHPVPSIRSAVILLLSISILLFAFGVALFIQSSDVVEIAERYDDEGQCDDTDWDTETECEITLDVKEDMKSPVYIYYELHNYYQNHRFYANSMSYKQLAGKDATDEDWFFCEPVTTIEDLELPTSQEQIFDDLDDDANPCGLVAKTVFNDTFNLFDQSGNAIKIEDDDLAWDFDKDWRFERDDDEQQWIDVENERFIIWMRVSGILNFRKLWGRIDQDLDEGEYKLRINSRYDLSDNDGEKWVILSTTNSFGGRHDWLAFYYMSVGAVCVILAILFPLVGCYNKRKQYSVTAVVTPR